MRLPLLAPVTSGTGTAVDLSPLLQYGIVGFVATVALVVAWTLYKRELRNADREKERADRLEAELRNLNETVRDQTMKALQDATTAMTDALDVLTHRRMK